MVYWGKEEEVVVTPLPTGQPFNHGLRSCYIEPTIIPTVMLHWTWLTTGQKHTYHQFGKVLCHQWKRIVPYTYPITFPAWNVLTPRGIINMNLNHPWIRICNPEENHSWEYIWLQQYDHLLPTPGNVLADVAWPLYFPPLGMYLASIIMTFCTLLLGICICNAGRVNNMCAEYNWFDWNRVKGPLCVLRWKLLMKDRVFLYGLEFSISRHIM